MNVTFVMAPGYEHLEKALQAMAKERNILGIEGHRSVGGFRASIYNAMPIESVKVLIQTMQEFEAQN
jgi:phosphoserine aminotransferase